jgi:NAD(P)-dependent dehydrogenase (short-subunit alcohol dehydrogenase family)
VNANPANGFRLDGRACIVTGGASGIGRAIAQRFAISGASVHIVDVNPVDAETVVREIQDSGGDAHFYSCDVSDQQHVKNVFQRIFEKERVHILVNNAGVSHVGKLESTTESDFDKIFRINVKGFYNCMLATIEHMKEQTGGVILNLASVAASAGLADRFAYSMSKGAIVAMTYSVAKDYLPFNIRCNCISPARIHTPFVDGFLLKNYPGREQEVFAQLSKAQPIGRMGTPQEVAGLALFLCSGEAGFITGMDYPLDGGFVNLRG